MQHLRGGVPDWVTSQALACRLFTVALTLRHARVSFRVSGLYAFQILVMSNFILSVLLAVAFHLPDNPDPVSIFPQDSGEVALPSQP